MMTSISRRHFAGWGLAAMGTLALSSCTRTEVPPTPVVPPQPPGLVWGHYLPHGLPDYTESGAPTYGASYPLDLVPGGSDATPRPGAGLARARQAGLNAMHIMLFEEAGNKGTDFVVDWMVEADRTWSSPDADGPFVIAPCLCVTTPAGFRRLATEYVAGAQRHASAARVDDRLVIFVYAARALSVEGWRDALASLGEIRRTLFVVGDIQPEASQHDGRIPAEATPYVKLFDAIWAFDDLLLEISPDLLTLASGAGATLVGGVMPGYNRETPGGGMIDPRGTRRLRDSWEAQLRMGSPWVVMLTWNDAVEHTDIKASSDWNHTRQEVTKFYSDRHRGRSMPEDPALFVTSVSHVWPGQHIRAEALVLNRGREAVRMTIAFRNSRGLPYGELNVAEVGPGSAGDASLSIELVEPPPQPTFVRATCTLADQSGRTLTTVTSAPILLYQHLDQVGRDRPDWYSVPASRALAGEVLVRSTGRARDGIHVQGPNANLRFLDLLQNTRSGGRAFDRGSHSFGRPTRQSEIVGPERVTVPTAGFYVGRAISSDERVAYSDPVWVPGD